MLDTGELLKGLGYEYYKLSDDAAAPPRVDTTFGEFLPGIRGKGLPIENSKLYLHQLRAYEALSSGYNVILRSGTGSGKTEAWFLYTAIRRARTLVVYPTLALSNDQVNRLRKYCEATGLRVMIIDAPNKSSLAARVGLRQVRRELANSDIVLTNPAFLLNEVKRLGSRSPPLLREFMNKLDLLVIDDFDFYSPRSIALLFAMLSIIRERMAPKVRFAFMTATLENPEDVASMLRSVNGCASVIIEGASYHPPNHTYVILGRDLKKLWEQIRVAKEAILKLNVGEDVKEALRDFDAFKKQYYKIIELAKLAGVQVPSEWIDIAEILANYIRDEGLTLVFTRSIAKAEEIARRLAEMVGPTRVAAHHHLLLKSEREEIEDAAKRGDIKVLISPRTLSQGIDIGSVIRVVHVGLPYSLREYLQREGRKGRREGITRTETLVIPLGSWDYSLLLRGTEALVKWLSLPREKVLINPENKYVKLMSGLFKLVNPSRRAEATKEELELLSSLGLQRGLELTERGKRAWMNMGFYEFAPPFGIKRIRRDQEGREERLEEVSHCDLVEKFQLGCIDYTSDGIVTAHSKVKSGGRAVTSIIIDDLSESIIRRLEPLAYALEEYRLIKTRWGEVPSIRRDYALGKLHSEVHCVVKTPNGFGRYVKVPSRVEWRLISQRSKVHLVGDRTVLSHDRRSILVPAITVGTYSDYTYGIHLEMDPNKDPEMLRLGLAFIELVMRRELGIPLDTIEYDVTIVSDRKFVSIHETESAGLLEKIDWLDFKRKIESYVPDALDEFLLESINEYAYSTFISNGLDWEVARHYATAIVEQLILRERVRVNLAGIEITLPRPSRALRRATLVLYDMPLDRDGSVTIYCVGVFDGERYRIPIGLKTYEGPDEAYIEAISAISHLLDNGFKIFVYERVLAEQVAYRLGLKSLSASIRGAESVNALIEVKPLIRQALSADLSLEEVERVLGLERERSATDIAVEAAKLRGDLSTRDKRLRALNRLGPIIEKVVRADLYNTYLLSLLSGDVLKEVLAERERARGA